MGRFDGFRMRMCVKIVFIMVVLRSVVLRICWLGNYNSIVLRILIMFVR